MGRDFSRPHDPAATVLRARRPSGRRTRPAAGTFTPFDIETTSALRVGAMQ